MGRWEVTAGVLFLSMAAVAGCSSGSQPHTQTPTPATTTVTGTSSSSSAPSASIDPRAQPAVDAYLKMTAAAISAKRDPKKSVAGTDPASDFRPYSFDPFRAEYAAYMMQLARDQVAYRGTPHEPRIKVKSVDLAAKPYPKVVLTNCQTPAPTWRAYDRKTGKDLPEPSVSVPPPYLLTVEVIQYDSHWGVQKIDGDRSRTCTA
jgi:hypothetical protein